MDIVVHGTKGGRHIFTPKKLGGLIDVNSDASKTSAIGQEAFALRFVEKAIIFSKYKIIRDVRGDKRTGFLGFSIFLPINKRLKGIDIISILDNVSREYCKRYIPENDNNLKDVKEEWSFLDRIIEEYKTNLSPVSNEDIEYHLSETKDDAYIYYKGDEDLQKYLDAPYQDVYNQYRQVLFVKEEFKEKPENPLNALRHSEDNLSGKIDLENPKYKLLFNQRTDKGVRIDIKVNSVIRSNNSKIRRKDDLEISWSKPYCKAVSKKGKWNEISNEFIDVNDSSESISINEIILSEESKNITFFIKDLKGTLVNDAKIICKSNDSDKIVDNSYQISFKGEDLGKRWTVSAYNNRFYSAERRIEFEKDCPGDIGNIDIVLNKHSLKKETVTVLDDSNGDIIIIFNLSRTEFTANEINEKHKITISCPEYNSDSFTYCPATDIDLEPIRLNKKQYGRESKTTQPYDVIAGEYGTKKLKNSDTLNKKNNILEKTYKRLLIALGIAVLLIVGVIIFYLRNDLGDFLNMNDTQKEANLGETKQNTYQYIQTYIKGNSLILDTLYEFKKSQSEIPQNVSKSLDSAIKKREAIDSLNFLEIKKLNYYENQSIFSSAISNLDASKNNIIRSKLKDKDISSWSLNRIADSINAILNLSKISNEDGTGEETKSKDEKGKKNKTNEAQSATPIQQETKPPNNENISSSTGKAYNNSAKAKSENTESDIRQKLKSSAVTRENLQNWETSGTAEFKNSINLYLEFWKFVSNGQKDDFENLLKKVNSDPVLKNSDLKIFLNTICGKNGAFDRFNGIPGKGKSKTLTDLNSKMK